MKKKNLIAICASALLIAAAVTACGGSTSETTAQAETEAEAADGEAGEAEAEGGEEAAADTIKVTFIATDTGLGDRSFNDSTWEGVQRAHDELGVEISIIEPDSVADMGTAIMTAVQSGSDLILGFGGSWADPLSEYCDRFPDVYFGGLNCNVTADNLQMAKTADHQGSFLAGALAATMTKTGTVACLGGQDADNINRFITGFEEGVKYVNPDVTVLKSYVGSYSDPALGKEYSLQLMNEGADIIFHIAGGTGEGLFEAARENAKLNGLDNCNFIAGDVLKTLDNISEKPDLIVLDPPRDGINPKALKKIVDYGVDRIVYISCKAQSLARDLGPLQYSGYRMVKACAVDQFPWTDNVETVVLLSRGEIGKTY